MRKFIKVVLLMFFVLSMTGCKKYYVDEDNIKSINEIEITILEKLNQNYNVGFELEFLSQEDYKLCEFYLHDCISYSDVSGAHRYTFDGISEEGYIFNVTYSDPYFDDEGTYHEEEIIENYETEKNSLSYDYHIKYYDDYIPGASYNLKLKKGGGFILYSQVYSSAEDVDTMYYKYEGNLETDTTEKVLEVLNYIKEKETIAHEIYEFYYDSEIDKNKMGTENEGYIKQIIYAVKSISEEDKIEDMSSKEYGTKIINDIHDELFNTGEEETIDE